MSPCPLLLLALLAALLGPAPALAADCSRRVHKLCGLQELCHLAQCSNSNKREPGRWDQHQPTLPPRYIMALCRLSKKKRRRYCKQVECVVGVATEPSVPACLCPQHHAPVCDQAGAGAQFSNLECAVCAGRDPGDLAPCVSGGSM